jgi:eukaryotic-like serine/threonine-protein kinase
VLIDGRYDVECELGRGAMGVVYLARDTGLRRRIAVKLIAPALVQSSSSAERFCEEARALASVQSHHVVQVYALGEHEDSYFFAMEYVRGRTLHTILAEHRLHGENVSIHRALTILARIAEGLDAAHAAGLVHRDVKPANIVIEEDTGRPVLLDFGLAVRRNGARVANFAGTPGYTAPEQTGFVSRASVGPWTDVYSLGCTAFEIFAGRIPFDDEDPDKVLMSHAKSAPPRLSALRPTLAKFDAVLARAMAKAPADRFASASEFVKELIAVDAASVLTGDPTLPSTVQPRTPDEARFILVVDDDQDFRRFATRSVQLAFYRQSVRVAMAASGAEALSIVEQRAPDLLVLDFDMPGLDGADTLSRIRALPQGVDVRVLVVSGRVGPADKWRFSLLGVNDFLAKPIDIQRFVETLGSIADRAGWLTEPPDESDFEG